MEREPVSEARIVIGVFDDREALERALEELREAGFREDQSAVTMRGLPEGAGKGRESSETVDRATHSTLAVKVEGRHSDAEEILRRNGAGEIRWSNSLTASMAGSTDEIVDSSS